METTTTDHKKSCSVACRPLEAKDRARVEELHAGQSTELPDFANPLTVVKEGIEADGVLIAAGIARLELNVTLLIDRDWGTPMERLAAITQLQEEMRGKASALGLDWAYAEVPERWGKRLEELGWKPAKNRLYYLRID